MFGLRRVLRTVIVLLVLVGVYLGIIYSVNLLLTLYKDKVVQFFDKDPGIRVKFDRVELTPSLVLKVDKVSISWQFLEIYLENCVLCLDLRKPILGQLPISCGYLSNVNVAVVGTLPDTNDTGYYGGDIYYLVKALRYSKFRLDRVRIVSEKVKANIREFLLSIRGDGSISYDVNTLVSLGVEETFDFLHSLVVASGFLQLDVSGRVSSFVGLFSLKENKVLGTPLKDIEVDLSFRDGVVRGLALSENYYGHIEFSPDAVKAELKIKDLSDEASQAEVLREIKAVLPDIEKMVKTAVRDAYLVVTSDYSGILAKLNSQSVELLYESKPNFQTLFVLYRHSGKRIVVSLTNSNLVVDAKNLTFMNLPLSVFLDVELSPYVLVRNSYVNTPFVKGTVLDNLMFREGVVSVSNRYISGQFDVRKVEGKFRVGSFAVSEILEGLELPEMGFSELDISVKGGEVRLEGKGEEVFFSALFLGNSVILERFDLKRVGVEATGRVVFTDSGPKGVLNARCRGVEETFEVMGTREVITFASGKYGAIQVVPSKSLINLSLGGIRVGDVEIVKLGGSLGSNAVFLEGELSYSGIRIKSGVRGDFSKVSAKGYIYTRTKALAFSGDVYFEGGISGFFEVEDSLLSFRLLPDEEVLISGYLNRLRVPIQTPIGLVTELDGNFRVKVDLKEKELIRAIDYLGVNVTARNEGIFSKVVVNAVSMENSTRVNVQLFNYFSVFHADVNISENTVGSFILAKDRISKRRSNEGRIALSGKWENDEFRGKVWADIEGFSGLSEKWERDVYISPTSIRVEGSGDGIRFFKNGSSVNLSYTRGNVVLYEFSGEVDKGSVSGKLSGRIPLGFLVIPGFIESVDAELRLNNVEVRLRDGKLEVFGNSYFSGKHIKTCLAEDVFYVPSSRIEFIGNRVVAENVRFLSGSKEVSLSGTVYFDNLDNPSIDLEIVQVRGIIDYSLDLGGGLKIRGPSSNATISIKGSAVLPEIRGSISFLRNTKIEYFLLQSAPSTSGEFWGYNFAQIANWNLRVSFVDAWLESEVLEGKVENSIVEVKGRFSQNTLSIVGYANLSSGVLKYLGKYFTVDSLQLVFEGKEMNFVPFASGSLYTYAYDSRTGESVRVIMRISGKLDSIRTSFSSEPERSQAEIALLLGLPMHFVSTLKQGVSLVETIGVYDFISYNVRRYTGLDIFTFRAPLLSAYLTSFLEGSYSFSLRDILRGTEIRVGKNILPSVLLEYRMRFDIIGGDKGYTNVALHTFLVGWSFYSFVFELQYSSTLFENKPEFEPRLNIRFNRSF